MVVLDQGMAEAVLGGPFVFGSTNLLFFFFLPSQT